MQNPAVRAIDTPSFLNRPAARKGTCSLVVQLLHLTQEGVFLETRLLFGVDTPEGPFFPKTPLPVPPRDKKGYHSVPF